MTDKSLRAGLTGQARTVEIFAVVTNTDLDEGRGQLFDHSYYYKREDAVVGAAGEGVFSTDARVEPRLALYFGTRDNGYYFVLGKPIKFSDVADKRKALKQKAESKLSTGEKAALGR